MNNVSQIIKQQNKNVFNDKERLIHATAEIKASVSEWKLQSYVTLFTNVPYMQDKYSNSLSI